MAAVIAWLEGKKTTIGLLLLAVYEIGANAGGWGYEQNVVILIGLATGLSAVAKVNRLSS